MEKEIVAAMAAAEASEEAPVSVVHVSSCFVKPSSPAPPAPETMFLSAGDIMWRWFYYNQRVLFFALSPNREQQKQPEEEEEECRNHKNNDEKKEEEEVMVMTFEEAVRKLKAGLAMALVEFYPWAGRLFEREDGRLSLLCNHAGVQFIEARVNLPFSSLALHGFQYRDFFKDLAPMGDALCWTSPELPLLSIQVTRFQDDGGLAIGTGRSHVVSDGHSFWHFMKSWGECSRGLPISIKPLHMRTHLEPHNLILPCRTDHPISQLSHKSVTRGGSFDLGPPSTQQVAQRCFHFTAAMIQRLKDMAMEEGHHTGAAFSSFQVLCAHMWKHVTKAHALIKDQPTSGVRVIANYRNRLQPPLPPSYFGNVIFWDIAKAPSASLQKDSLGAIARRIQDMITSMKDEAFRQALGNLEVLNPNVVLLKDMEPDMVLLSVASSPKFPVYEVDFGWGKPVCVRPACIRTSGDILLFPGPNEHGSVDVCISLEKEVMEKLEHDQSFLSPMKLP